MKNSSSMQTPPPGWRMDPRFIECKTRRAPLMMPPSLHERAKVAAAKAGMSFNSWCLQAIEATLKAQEDAAAQETAPAADGVGAVVAVEASSEGAAQEGSGPVPPEQSAAG